MPATFQSQCSRKLSLCQEPWPGPGAEMLLSHSLTYKGHRFQVSFVVCRWAMPCSPLQNNAPSGVYPRERTELHWSVVGCSEGASDARVLLGWLWQLQPQQKAGRGKKLGCRVNTRTRLKPMGAGVTPRCF